MISVEQLYLEARENLAAAKAILQRRLQSFDRRPWSWSEPKLSLAEIRAMTSAERIAYIEWYCRVTPSEDAE